MRLPILLFATACAAFAAAPAQAVGTRYPFCITGEDQPGLSNCTFTSYEQCAATASGRFLSCIPNPYYVPEGDAPPPAAYGRSVPPPPPPPGYRRY
ncbi:DUF3551 domain-containing protein [Bradyrhizobium sp.]|uniref:DUF3551 domain-containing protein n=1 Tax=Bradyrhizobium sp. TaxID=376 RepID=UPI001D1D4837|nr:DUF3551 domain-containing protein [Bradyrhizobium sp.]MBI5319833.1 DUF3551 domain-containing protein [Bradyrhizobium sp.]